MNLAPWKYRNVIKSKGGPIDHVNLHSITIHGAKYYDAYAYLNQNLIDGHTAKPKIYGTGGGMGTSQYANVAYYKAISEALERWAHAFLINAQNAAYGFNIDASTSGMAAFPGLTSHEVRRSAFFEAVERWSLQKWWSGELNHEFIKIGDINAIRILSPWTKVSIVLLWQKISGLNLTAYGFAAARDRNSSYQHGLIELIRNSRVIERFCGRFYPNGFTRPDIWSDVNDMYEKRLLYFATEIGHHIFKNRLAATFTIFNNCLPRCLIDEELRGSWSRYCKVWRVLFEPSTTNKFLDNDIGHFLF